jgi:hypothetical protein
VALYFTILSLIGNILAIVGAGAAFFEAETKGRIFILTLMALTFIIPKIWASLLISSICFVLRMVLAIGCYVYVKYQSAA